MCEWRGSRLLGPARESWQGQTCHKLSRPILFQGLKVELVMVKVLVAPLDNSWIITAGSFKSVFLLGGTLAESGYNAQNPHIFGIKIPQK